MSLAFKISPKEKYFSGNPIVFYLQSDSGASINYSVKTNGKTVFEGIVFAFERDGMFEAKVEVSEIFNTHFKEYTIPDSDLIISPVADFFLEADAEFEQSDFKIEHSARIFRGGISNNVIFKLEENGYDIWTYRLKSYFDQFLFTGRTNGKEIKLKETELFPFVFIHPGIPIVFKSESGAGITTPAQTAGTICAMDIQSALKKMPAGTKRIDVCPDGEYAFHFTVLPGKLSEEKYLLRFRNSLGAFEMLEVTGRAMHTPEFSEESLYETLTDFYFYEERRSRVKSKGIIEVETGYKERREFPFIMDMIQSDEIYFIYPDSDSFRCHVKTDSAQYRHLMAEPTSIKLKIREVMEEEFFTPKIDYLSDDFSRIFDETFDETFN